MNACATHRWFSFESTSFKKIVGRIITWACIPAIVGASVVGALVGDNDGVFVGALVGISDGVPVGAALTGDVVVGASVVTLVTTLLTEYVMSGSATESSDAMASFSPDVAIDDAIDALLVSAVPSRVYECKFIKSLLRLDDCKITVNTRESDEYQFSS